MEILNRLQKLQQFLGKGRGVMLVSPASRYYFLGFNADDAHLFITESSCFLLTDSRYSEAAEKNCKYAEVLTPRRHFEKIAELCKEQNIETVFCDVSSVSYAEFSSLSKALGSTAELSTSAEAEAFIKELRSIKTEREISLIKSAQDITEKTFEYILDKIKVGKTEMEIKLDMEFFSRKTGSEEVAFDFIVISGKKTSLPHGVSSDKQIEKGDFVTLDFGATVGGYRSDMTRTVAVGAPTDKQLEVYNTVLRAQENALKNIKAGITAKTADAYARDIIAKAGYGEYFGHSLGHGVGLEIHEAPNLSPYSDVILKVGNIVTVEPGIYIPDTFGVRIEDMVRLTEKGLENLTKADKTPIIL